MREHSHDRSRRWPDPRGKCDGECTNDCFEMPRESLGVQLKQTEKPCKRTSFLVLIDPCRILARLLIVRKWKVKERNSRSGERPHEIVSAYLKAGERLFYFSLRKMSTLPAVDKPTRPSSPSSSVTIVDLMDTKETFDPLPELTDAVLQALSTDDTRFESDTDVLIWSCRDAKLADTIMGGPRSIMFGSWKVREITEGVIVTLPRGSQTEDASVRGHVPSDVEVRRVVDSTGAHLTVTVDVKRRKLFSPLLGWRYEDHEWERERLKELAAKRVA